MTATTRGASIRHPGDLRVLLLATGAFFLTFVVWFNMAPFNVVIKRAFDLTPAQLAALMQVNVALTIPARILIGRLVDRFGPRAVYAALLVVLGVPCILFGLASQYWQLLLLRVLLSCIGAGFVVGIRMVAEWFPPRYVGAAEGLYAGWGNFGSAAAAFTLPLVALWIGGDEAWRWSIGLTGALVMAYGILYYLSVRDTPEGVAYRRPRRASALEVSSWGDLWGLMALSLPTYMVLGILAWRIVALGVLPPAAATAITVLLALAYLADVYQAWNVNRPRLLAGVPDEERYAFRQVAILSLAYFVNFGGELAVVSMLPQFFAERFDLSLATAGMAASLFAFTNLFARPGGGWLADRLGRRRTLAFLMGGLGMTFTLMGLATRLDAASLRVAAVLTVLTSLFVQASEGAVFATVPLVNRRVTGQVAGIVGAYGNLGAVVWLLILQQLGPAGMFVALGVGGIASMALTLWLSEPEAGRAGKPVFTTATVPARTAAGFGSD